jgi:hypothetical protein
MKIGKLAASMVAVVAVVLGLGLTTVSTAAAADSLPGRWVAYGTKNPISTSTSEWRCGTTWPVTASGDVVAQVCVIATPDFERGQGAVIVRNNRSSLYGAEAAVDLSKNVGGHEQFWDRWECPRSGVGAKSWSVCFGDTRVLPLFEVRARGGVNGVDLGVSPGL